MGLAGPDPKRLNTLAKAGAVQEVIDQIKANERADVIELCMSKKAWKMLLLFSQCQTQWNKGFGGLDGLNYDGLKIVAEIANIKVDAEGLRYIRVMEQAVLAEVQERVRTSRN